MFMQGRIFYYEYFIENTLINTFVDFLGTEYILLFEKDESNLQ